MIAMGISLQYSFVLKGSGQTKFWSLQWLALVLSAPWICLCLTCKEGKSVWLIVVIHSILMFHFWVPTLFKNGVSVGLASQLHCLLIADFET